MLSLRDRVIGCVLGGAAGDALGAPVEFNTIDEIRARFGPDGITRYAPAYGRLGAITDDTQMTLFTAEGLLRAHVRGSLKGIVSVAGVVGHAYQRWLRTQAVAPETPLAYDPPGWLVQQPDLHHRRAPGMTCVSALQTMGHFSDRAGNDSKGCGGVMRMAPAGLYAARVGLDVRATFGLGVDLAALTHGHPTGQLTSGVFAVMIQALCGGASMRAALETGIGCLPDTPNRDETLAALEQAIALAGSGTPRTDAVARLGAGWIAEEALAIAVYCALVARDFGDGIVLAVNHSGDSDSTGAIAGNLLGAHLGIRAIDAAWLEPLELRDVITGLGEDLVAFPDWRLNEYEASDPAVWEKYPGT